MKTLSWIPIFATLGALLGACSHEVESPSPKGSGAEPDLVCNDAPVGAMMSTVVLHGQNFTPMPSKTLEDKRQLVLPKVTLSQKQALPGDMGVTAPIVIADDPAHPEASRVHWATEQLMSFDIKPEDKLATGVFSVTITNPDGKGATTIDRGLAIIPPPLVSMVKPPAICDEEADQQIVITGANFLVYDGKVPSVSVGDMHTYTPKVDDASCTALTGNFVEKNVKVCTSMTVTIPKGDFKVTAATTLPLNVTNPEPADCASSKPVEITIEPPPEVDEVKPSTVCEGGSQLTITGKGFITGATVSLDCMGTTVDASAVNVNMDGTQIAATFGPGAVAGNQCDVIVKNPDGCQDLPLPHKKVTVTAGPILFYVDPPVIYNGINTRVTLYATTITPPLPTGAVTIVPTGQTMPVTTLQFNAVPNHPNRLQVIVPSGQATGTYDVILKDNSGCFASLPKAITVTNNLTVTLKSVEPPFGDTARDTAVTIFRDTTAAAPANAPFVETPRVFLNPVNAQPTDIAVEVESVSFVDGNTATGVVPAKTPVHAYDVVLVNPDGTVGLLKNGYTEVLNAPPTIDSATPSSIVAATGQTVQLLGSGFGAGDKVSLRCVDANGTELMSPGVTSSAPTCNGASCTQSIVINGSTLAAGDVCVVRVTNADGTYGEYSAIGVTTPSLNLNAPHAGPAMNVGRRALSAASGNATPAARFLYALGGDSGQASGALDSVELAPVDLFGKIGAWVLQKGALSTPRTLAGEATVGRYIYLVGGENGTGPVATAERALILSPRETPVVEDVDLALGMKGLDAGEYHYRVSATFAATDTDNPGGESLASDAFTIKLPDIAGKKIAVTLVWKAPVDSLGAPLAGVSGYRIYRSPMPNSAPGSEVLLGTVTGAATVSFTDDGSAMPGTDKPLPTGSTGAWAHLPTMSTPRSGASVAAGYDPVTPGRFYVYALLGRTGAGTVTDTYEYLPVTVAPNGRQTFGPAWVAGAQRATAARSQAGAWVVTSTVTSVVTPPDTWVFLGGGMLGNNTLTGKVDAGKIGAGGDLGVFSDGPKDFSADSAGYGVCAANDQLFVFGGQGAAPSSGAKSATLVAPPPTLAPNSWNNEGLSMTHGRYLMGSAVQSSFIFLLGGQTDEPSLASKTTELVIW